MNVIEPYRNVTEFIGRRIQFDHDDIVVFLECFGKTRGSGLHRSHD